MSKVLLKRHVFYFNEEKNNDSDLTLVTHLHANGDLRGAYCSQELSCKDVSLYLKDAISPESLRKLADELETVYAEANLTSICTGV